MRLKKIGEEVSGMSKCSLKERIGSELLKLILEYIKKQDDNE